MGVVIITGGNRGMGRATAVKFAEEGHDVVLTYRKRQLEADEVVERIAKLGQRAFAVKMDISIQADIDNAFDAIFRRFNKIDYLFNNVGIMNSLTPFVEQHWEMWERIMAVNVIGQWYLTKKVVGTMMKNGGGSVVYASSISGVLSYPLASDYVATKHAVVGMAKAQALECAGHNIRINVICPGFFKSDMYNENFSAATEEMTRTMVPAERIAEPEEMAKLVYWLLVEGSYCFGSAVVIDGGITAGPKLNEI